MFSLRINVSTVHSFKFTMQTKDFYLILESCNIVCIPVDHIVLYNFLIKLLYLFKNVIEVILFLNNTICRV